MGNWYCVVFVWIFARALDHVNNFQSKLRRVVYWEHIRWDSESVGTNSSLVYLCTRTCLRGWRRIPDTWHEATLPIARACSPRFTTRTRHGHSDSKVEKSASDGNNYIGFYHVRAHLQHLLIIKYMFTHWHRGQQQWAAPILASFIDKLYLLHYLKWRVCAKYSVYT